MASCHRYKSLPLRPCQNILISASDRIRGASLRIEFRQVDAGRSRSRGPPRPPPQLNRAMAAFRICRALLTEGFRNVPATMSLERVAMSSLVSSVASFLPSQASRKRRRWLAVFSHASGRGRTSPSRSRSASGSSLRASAGSSYPSSSVGPRLRWCAETRSYRRTAEDHRKAARPPRRYVRRASGRLCSTLLHHSRGTTCAIHQPIPLPYQQEEQRRFSRRNFCRHRERRLWSRVS